MKYEIREYVLVFTFDKNNRPCRRWQFHSVQTYKNLKALINVIRITFRVLRRYKSSAMKYTIRYIKKGGAKRV